MVSAGKAARVSPTCCTRCRASTGSSASASITLHAAYVTSAFARAIAECDKVDRFLPLPAQSGSNDVLRRMKRGYTVDLYRGRVAILREEIPDIELSSDWIVGFPGESEADFAASLDLLGEVGFAQNYVFSYDPRPDTTAADKLADDVSAERKKERHRELLAEAERVQGQRLARYRGTLVRAFVESRSERDPSTLLGHTTHGLPISFRGSPELVGSTVCLRVEGTTSFGMGGAAT